MWWMSGVVVQKFHTGVIVRRPVQSGAKQENSEVSRSRERRLPAHTRGSTVMEYIAPAVSYAAQCLTSLLGLSLRTLRLRLQCTQHQTTSLLCLSGSTLRLRLQTTQFQHPLWSSLRLLQQCTPHQLSTLRLHQQCTLRQLPSWNTLRILQHCTCSVLRCSRSSRGVQAPALFILHSTRRGVHCTGVNVDVSIDVHAGVPHSRSRGSLDVFEFFFSLTPEFSRQSFYKGVHSGVTSRTCVWTALPPMSAGRGPTLW